jgi:tRNA (cytidine/uridine-2'-O-)-methyltransferase
VHTDWDALAATMATLGGQAYALTTRGTKQPHDCAFAPGDWLVFGSETAGLPSAVRDGFPAERQLRLPMRAGQRSLNLSNAVAVVVYEAWRQHGFIDAAAAG